MKKELKKYFSKLGKKGGKNRMASMTTEMRRDFAMKGVRARKNISRQTQGRLVSS